MLYSVRNGLKGPRVDSHSSRELIVEYARGMEFYGLGDHIITRLQERHYKAAAVYCSEAAELAMLNIDGSQSEDEKQHHTRNYTDLKRLETMIRDLV